MVVDVAVLSAPAIAGIIMAAAATRARGCRKSIGVSRNGIFSRTWDFGAVRLLKELELLVQGCTMAPSPHPASCERTNKKALE